MRMTRWLFTAVLALALPSSARAEPLRCDLTLYKPSKGLTATIAEDSLVVSWQGDRGRELRMRLTVAEGRPIIRDLAIRNSGTTWASEEYISFVTGASSSSCPRAERMPATLRNGTARPKSRCTCG